MNRQQVLYSIKVEFKERLETRSIYESVISRGKGFPFPETSTSIQAQSFTQEAYPRMLRFNEEGELLQGSARVFFRLNLL